MLLRQLSSIEKINSIISDISIMKIDDQRPYKSQCLPCPITVSFLPMLNNHICHGGQHHPCIFLPPLFYFEECGAQSGVEV